MLYSHSYLLYVMTINILVSAPLIFLSSRLLKGLRSINIQVKDHPIFYTTSKQVKNSLRKKINFPGILTLFESLDWER